MQKKNDLGRSEEREQHREEQEEARAGKKTSGSGERSPLCISNPSSVGESFLCL